MKVKQLILMVLLAVILSGQIAVFASDVWEFQTEEPVDGNDIEAVQGEEAYSPALQWYDEEVPVDEPNEPEEPDSDVE